MENTHDLIIHEIFNAKRTDESYLCESFVVYPDGKEKLGGFLMGIIELRATPKKEGDKLIKTLISTIKEEYYNQINASPATQKLNLETVFEYALQRTNNSLLELIEIGHFSVALENLHYVIAVAKPDHHTREIELYFTQQGLTGAQLVHRTKQNYYKNISIIDNAPKTGHENSSRIKIFSSILTGNVSFHDTVYFCSEMFSSFITPTKVTTVLANNNLAAGVDYFKTLIHNLRGDSYLAHAAIFLRFEEKRLSGQAAASEESINQLISTKQKTEKFLTPTFTLNIFSQLRKIVDSIRFTKRQSTIKEPAHQQQMRLGLGRFVSNLFSLFFKSIGGILGGIWGVVSGKQKLSADGLKNGFKGFFGKLGSLLSSLLKINKKVVFGIIIVIAALTTSVVLIQKNAVKQRDLAEYNRQLASIKELLDSANVNLIYQDNGQSLTAVKSAEEKIIYLPQATPAQKTNFEDLKRQSETIKNKLLKVEKVVPQLFAELPNPTGTRLQLAGNALVVSHETNLILVDAKTKALQTQRTSLSDIETISAEGSNVLIMSKAHQVALYNADNKQLQLAAINWGKAKISGAQLFNSSLYVIDATTQQIYKYPGNGASFSAEQTWLKSKTADLGSVTDMVIDADLYAVNAAGQVFKFFRGNQQDLPNPKIEPPITNASRIFTSKDLNALYLLDSANKRIIVLTKNGEFTKQLVFDSLADPISDLVVTTEQIFLLSGNKIFSSTVK